MKGKLNLKTIIVLVILSVVAVLGVVGVKSVQTYISGAAGGTEPKDVLATPSADGKSATVTWTSDKVSMGVVEYGTTPASLLLRAVEPEQTLSHSLTLTPLKGGVTYYFRIRIGDNVYDNEGIPYSFKTAVSTEPVTPTVAPTAAPTISVGTTTATTSAVATCDRTTDYNKDNVVNSLDYIYCQKNPSTVSVGTTQAGGAGASTCQAGVDYNKDGVVNSFDILKCRQEAQK